MLEQQWVQSLEGTSVYPAAHAFPQQPPPESGKPALINAWPQVQAPQSPGQLVQFSPLSQPFAPQTAAHAPQSAGQLLQFSPLSQPFAPQTAAQTPQSTAGEAMQGPQESVPAV